MEIVYGVYEYPPKIVGGLGTYADNITQKIKEKGHKIEVYTLHHEGLKEIEAWNGIIVNRPRLFDINKTLFDVVNDDLANWGVGFGFFSNIFLYNVLSTQEALKKEKPNLIVVHDWLSSILGINLKKNLGEPLVFHIHSTEEGRASMPSKTVKLIEKRTAEIADKVITVSNAMKQELHRLGYNEDKIEVVWNGINEKKYDAKRFTKQETEKIRKKHKVKKDMILFIGRLTWVKGAKNLVKAIEIVKKDYPDVKLIMIGQGEEYDNIMEIIKKNKLEKNVEIINKWIDEEERIKYYIASDLAVFPSLYEPFGIVCTEAMALEKPVVVGASNTSGMREQVVNSGSKQTGVHVDPNKVEDIAWGIKEILKKSKKEREKIGKNGRKRVLENFTWDKVAEKTMKIYESVIKANK